MTESIVKKESDFKFFWIEPKQGNMVCLTRDDMIGDLINQFTDNENTNCDIDNIMRGGFQGYDSFSDSELRDEYCEVFDGEFLPVKNTFALYDSDGWDVATYKILSLIEKFGKGLEEIQKEHPDLGIGDTDTDERITDEIYSRIH